MYVSVGFNCCYEKYEKYFVFGFFIEVFYYDWYCRIILFLKIWLYLILIIEVINVGLSSICKC